MGAIRTDGIRADGGDQPYNQTKKTEVPETEKDITQITNPALVGHDPNEQESFQEFYKAKIEAEILKLEKNQSEYEQLKEQQGKKIAEFENKQKEYELNYDKLNENLRELNKNKLNEFYEIELNTLNKELEKLNKNHRTYVNEIMQELNKISSVMKNYERLGLDIIKVQNLKKVLDSL